MELIRNILSCVIIGLNKTLALLCFQKLTLLSYITVFVFQRQN